MPRGRELSLVEFLVESNLDLNLGFDQASAHVQWMVIRENSSFLHKRKLGTFTVVGYFFCVHFSSSLPYLS